MYERISGSVYLGNSFTMLLSTVFVRLKEENPQNKIKYLPSEEEKLFLVWCDHECLPPQIPATPAGVSQRL